MHPIDFSIQAFTSLATSTTNEELGAIMRIAVHIASTGSSIRVHRAHLVASMPESEWINTLGAIAEHLVFDDSREMIIGVSGQPALLSRKPASAAAAPKAHGGEATPLVIGMPIVSNIRTAPSEIKTHDLRKTLSIMQVAFNTGVAIITQSGKSEATARAILAQMLKTYNDGPVVHAINELNKKGDVAEPVSWIHAFLEYHYSSDGKKKKVGATRGRGRTAGYEPPQTSAPPSRTDRPIATAEALGISPERARKIQERNKLLSRPRGEDTNK